MPKNELPPGADPELQGYMNAAWGWKRTPPNWHKLHNEEFKQKWLKGYDEFEKRRR